MTDTTTAVSPLLRVHTKKACIAIGELMIVITAECDEATYLSIKDKAKDFIRSIEKFVPEAPRIDDIVPDNEKGEAIAQAFSDEDSKPQ